MRTVAAICLLTCLYAGSALGDNASVAEIDHDVWSVISRTVEDGDIKGMAAVYHEDGVLVGGSATVSIAEQLVKWGQDMEVQKQLGTLARVAFRFSSRVDDKATAFEAGIFQYTVTEHSGEETTVYVEFEALMVKKRGTWLILMERQLEPADPAAWAVLGEGEGL